MLKLKVRNFHQFNHNFNKDVDRSLESQFEKRQFNIIETLKKFSPVDTGLLRSSWFLEDVRDLGFHRHTPTFSSTLSLTLFSRKNKQLGRLYNSTSYAVFVNYGTSKRPPTYFVEKALQKFGKMSSRNPVGFL